MTLKSLHLNVLIGYSDGAIYIGYDEDSNWNIVCNNLKIDGNFKIENANNELYMICYLYNNLTNSSFYDLEKEYLYKRTIVLNSYEGNIYINRNRNCEMILKLNDEVYLCGTVYKTGKDYKYYQTSIDDINELDEYVKFFENEELQDILKTMTYMKDFKVYKLNEDRYLELGNIIKEEYNISCLSDNKKTDKENSVTPEDEIKIVNDYEEEKAIIFINKAKKISLDTNMKESFDGIVNKRFFESSTFNVYIQNNISCYGNIITEKNNDHEILFFNHLKRLYNSEYYENKENSFMEYRNVGELNGFFYTDDGIRFFHDICIDEEQGLYMSIMCYDPTGKEKNIDANKLYYSDNYQKMLNSIKIEDITKDDYNDYMKNLDKIVKEEVKKQ